MAAIRSLRADSGQAENDSRPDADQHSEVIPITIPRKSIIVPVQADQVRPGGLIRSSGDRFQRDSAPANINHPSRFRTMPTTDSKPVYARACKERQRWRRVETDIEINAS
jgi:hypothetical protein